VVGETGWQLRDRVGVVDLIPSKRLLSMLTGILMAVLGLYVLMVETSMYRTWSVALFGAAVLIAGLAAILSAYYGS
jgi:uncharacterized membrane protein HdeD (DUF308 family)